MRGNVSSVGLVLGGGFITGAAFETAALMSIQTSTGWDPRRAEVMVGTSAGAFVAALVRGGRLGVEALIGGSQTRSEVAEYISGQVFLRQPSAKMGVWFKHGLLPGLRRPGLSCFLGAPALFSASGVAGWVKREVGDLADGWPEAPTTIVTYDIGQRKRVALGTVGAPTVSLAEAVAASSSVPLIFAPYQIGEGWHVDGGVTSGTHADLVLGHHQPLDLVLVLAPLAMETNRRRAGRMEKMLDRVGRATLRREVKRIKAAWPETEVLVIRPPAPALEVMRPRPMKAKAAVPSFIRTMLWMRTTLSQPEVWEVLQRHLGAPDPPLPRAKIPDRLRNLG